MLEERKIAQFPTRLRRHVLLFGALNAGLLFGCGVSSQEESSSSEPSSVVTRSALLTGDALVIVTNNELKTASAALPAYLSMRRLIQPVIVVTENSTELADGTVLSSGWAEGADLTEPDPKQNAHNRADAIRAWLQANYVASNIRYALLIGDPSTEGGELPMKNTYPAKHVEDLAIGRPYFMESVKALCDQWKPGIDPGCVVCDPKVDPKCKACDPKKDPLCQLCDPVVDPNCTPCDPVTGENCPICDDLAHEDCLVWKDPRDLIRSAPTDYYYSDLTNVWPVDADGDITSHIEIDFSHQDVHVGRLPVTKYAGVYDIASMDKTLNKFVAYTTSKNTAWRRNALLVMDAHGIDGDGNAIGGWYAPLGEAANDNIFMPNGFSTYRIYEEYTPNGCTDPSCVIKGDLSPVTVENVGSLWTYWDYGVVFWSTHGWGKAAHDVIDIFNPDKNYVPNLDDQHPSFVVSMSCSTAYPEETPPPNITTALLDNGAIGLLASTRITWPGRDSWDAPYYLDYASSIDLGYGFLQELVVNGLSGGEALSAARAHLWNHPLSTLPTPAGPPPATAPEAEFWEWWTPWDQKEAWKRQLLIFNYFGDPTIGLENEFVDPAIPLSPFQPQDTTLTAGQPISLYADQWPGMNNPWYTPNVILTFNSLTGGTIPAVTVVVNGVTYTTGGTGKYYQIINIPDAGPYNIQVTSTQNTALQIQLNVS